MPRRAQGGGGYDVSHAQVGNILARILLARLGAAGVMTEAVLQSWILDWLELAALQLIVSLAVVQAIVVYLE